MIIQRPLLNQDPAKGNLNWLLTLRSYVLILQYPLSVAGNYFGYLNNFTHGLLLAIITLFLTYTWLVKRRLVHAEKAVVSERIITWQIALDLSVFAALLYLSGGANNPFYAFFNVFAILAGMLSHGRIGFLLLGYLLVLVFSMNLDYLFPFDLQSVIHIGTQLFVFTIIFIIARSLGEQLAQGTKQLMQLTLFTERLDRLRSLGALSAGFSHEFASPLNTIKLRLKRLLKHTQANEDLSEALEATSECEEVLRKMNSSQLDLTSMLHEEIPVGRLVKDIVTNWQDQHAGALVHLEAKGEARIRVPRINFAQALLNLLDNAFDADPAGQIRIDIQETDNHIELSVQDQGSGFADEILEHVGEPFNTSKVKGTGLGIYTIYLFMDSVLGKIRIENTHPGARVTLSFPKVMA
jgi:two-component system, sensor histidine kinase RegB